MSSSNEISGSKSKTSPFEFRNTDLVSRLLAATPPYFYNMPLVPHGYFFSEMLRSLVQSKAEAARISAVQTNPRRPRKRLWSHGRLEHLPPKQPNDMPPPSWAPKLPENKEQFLERPLELTMGKIPPNSNEIQPVSPQKSNDINGQVPFMLPAIPQETNPSNPDLILPPLPPVWYPPLYPAPYGIDPLHFFIDLRVSGHIYDRKTPNTKDQGSLPHTSVGNLPGLGYPNSTVTSLDDLSSVRDSVVKQTRHASAFSVPTPTLNRTDPLNLSGNKYQTSPKIRTNDKPSKFDIKSMGFDTSTENNNGSNYILKNLTSIYHSVQNSKQNDEGMDLTSPKHEEESKEVIKNESNDNKNDDNESEKKKKCKDLRALIGLELVVDYVKHEKPGKQCSSEGSSSEIESNVSSPIVEVVTVPDIENTI